jgi:hypothetical protein
VILRFKPVRDTFITNVRKRAVPQTGSNFGAAHSLDLFKVSGVSGALGAVSGSGLSRLLLIFSTSSLDSLVERGLVSPSSFTSYRLRLKHATTSETLPTSYDAEVLPASGSWDEGRGMDVDEFLDKGFANWDKRTSTSFWVNRGGDFHASPVATYHFDDGFEDLDVDVTPHFQAWASGTIPNHGLLVRMTASVESDSVYTDYYIKRFYSRTTDFKDRAPYVEARWNDFLGDDRARMRWGSTGSLFLYNVSAGNFSNISGVGTGSLFVRIFDASGTLMFVTASHVGRPGIYSASFALPTGSYSGSVFYDSWFRSGATYMTGAFSLSHEGAVQQQPQSEFVARVVNLRNEYAIDEVPRLSVFFRRRGYNPTVVNTASMSVAPEIIERCFYAVENDSTRERVVPFGTGSQQHTRLSYDASGNYFYFPMQNLNEGEVYRLVFLVDRFGERQLIDEGFKFRVRGDGA